MTPPSSQRHDASAADSARPPEQARQGRAPARAARRRRAPDARPASTSPSVTRRDKEVHASWHGPRGFSELRIFVTPHGLQVTMGTWHHDGNVVEEAYTLHSRAQFDAWHAASATKFEHAVAHDEIRRFGHASLPD